MSPASMLVARNVREDISTGFVAVLLLASAVLVAYLATAGLPNDTADGVLSAPPTAQQPGAEVRAATEDFADAQVYRLPPVNVVGHREGAPAAIAGERQPRGPHAAQAKPAPMPPA